MVSPPRSLDWSGFPRDILVVSNPFRGRFAIEHLGAWGRTVVREDLGRRGGCRAAWVRRMLEGSVVVVLGHPVVPVSL